MHVTCHVMSCHGKIVASAAVATIIRQKKHCYERKFIKARLQTLHPRFWHAVRCNSLEKARMQALHPRFLHAALQLFTKEVEKVDDSNEKVVDYRVILIL